MFVDDLIWVLTGAGLGGYGTTIFKGSKAIIPDGDGPFISLIETGGAAYEGTHNAANFPAYVRPSVQITFRAMNYDTARNLAQTVYELLWPIQNQFINGTWYRELGIVQEPMDLQTDAVGRARIAFNVDCVKRLSPATS